MKKLSKQERAILDKIPAHDPLPRPPRSYRNPHVARPSSGPAETRAVPPVAPERLAICAVSGCGNEVTTHRALGEPAPTVCRGCYAYGVKKASGQLGYAPKRWQVLKALNIHSTHAPRTGSVARFNHGMAVERRQPRDNGA